MSKAKKLLVRIRNNPRAVRFDDLDTLMRRNGFEVHQGKGSHLAYVNGGIIAGVVRPHGGRTFVGVVYVLNCLDAIGEVDERDQDEEDEGEEAH